MKIYVTTDNKQTYRWSETVYFEISASLVLGTTNGTAYDGASGQTNSNNIALKQDQLTFASLSGLALTTVGSTKTNGIDMQKTTAETWSDENEFMLIEKTTGTNRLCRITKQQLQSSINTNTEYNTGIHITIDGNKDINLDSELTDMTKISSSAGSFTIGSEYEIVYIDDENGNNAGADFNYQTNKGSGLLELMGLDGPTGHLGIGVAPNSNHRLHANGDCNLSSGSVYRINGTAITDTTYNNGTNITIDGTNALNLDTDLTSVNSISSVNNTDLKLKSTGTGNILLTANKDYQSIGKIHLSRADSDAIRFNTIEYGNDSNISYIKFLVRHTGGNITLTREVLKLNSDLSSTFTGTVDINNTATTGYGSLEIGGNTGSLIDLKSPFSDDLTYEWYTKMVLVKMLARQIKN